MQKIKHLCLQIMPPSMTESFVYKADSIAYECQVRL